jgi:hypothetical protein
MLRAVATLDLEGFIGDAAQLLTEAILALAGLIDRPAPDRPAQRKG